MTGYALKCLIDGKVHLNTFHEVKVVVERDRRVQQYPEDWEVVRGR